MYSIRTEWPSGRVGIHSGTMHTGSNLQDRHARNRSIHKIITSREAEYSDLHKPRSAHLQVEGKLFQKSSASETELQQSRNLGNFRLLRLNHLVDSRPDKDEGGHHFVAPVRNSDLRAGRTPRLHQSSQQFDRACELVHSERDPVTYFEHSLCAGRIHWPIWG